MLPQNDVHTEFIRKKSRYETHSWLGLARPPEADLDGVGICEVAANVPHPVAPSMDHWTTRQNCDVSPWATQYLFAMDWFGHLAWMSSGWSSWYVLLP